MIHLRHACGIWEGQSCEVGCRPDLIYPNPTSAAEPLIEIFAAFAPRSIVLAKNNSLPALRASQLQRTVHAGVAAKEAAADQLRDLFAHEL